MFKEITLRSFLSYGPTSAPIELRSLNVLLGANGTGKSNLVAAIGLLASCPRREGLADHLREHGGISEWIFKGDTGGRRSLVVEAVVEQADRHGAPPLRHRIELAEAGGRVEVVDERIENAEAQPGKKKPFFYFGYEAGVPMVHLNDKKRGLARDSVRPDDSILAQRTDPDVYPVLHGLAEQYERIKLFRGWTFGPSAPSRNACRTDAPPDFLRPDGHNLALIVNQLTRLPSSKRQFESLLQTLSPGFESVTTTTQSNLIELFLIEEGDRLIPASRLSDGTLRFLGLLSILLHPQPPPVIVLEEPELGIHPDILPTIARLLLDASKRTQLVVTTHSDILVDALTERPDAVLFCDKEEGSTVIRRADPDAVLAWCGKDAQDRKGLGQAWLAGAFGGKRW